MGKSKQVAVTLRGRLINVSKVNLIDRNLGRMRSCKHLRARVRHLRSTANECIVSYNEGVGKSKQVAITLRGRLFNVSKVNLIKRNLGRMRSCKHFRARVMHLRNTAIEWIVSYI